MIDKPLTFNVATDKVHAAFIMPTDDVKADDTYIHPCFAFANESGYIRNFKIAWRLGLARKFVRQYNQDVLGIDQGQAEAIMASSMCYPKCPYPQHYERNKELFDKFNQKATK